MLKPSTQSRRLFLLTFIAVTTLVLLTNALLTSEPLKALTLAPGAQVAGGTRAVSTTSAGPRQSSPIALSADDHLLANVNPDSDTLTLFDVTTDAPAKLAEVAVGREPRSVAIDPNGTLAYVANAAAGTVSVVNLATHALTDTLTVGAEPMALALSPNGTRLYVANSSSNNLMVLDTAVLTVVATIDLSPYGTAPRAIAVSNNGDAVDTDETIFVAMFFAQLRAGKTYLDEGQDDQREGRVVAISAATNTVLGAPNPVVLAPLADTGFMSNGQLAPAPFQIPAVASTNPPTYTTPTAAFPNQLASIALQPGASRAYVVSTGASPNGPLRFNTNNQGLVSVFNAISRTEITAGQTDPNFRRTAPLNLNQGVNLAFSPTPMLFNSNPVAMAWRPDGSDAWVVIQDTDLVVRLTADGSGIPTINAPLVPGTSLIYRVDLENVTGGQIAGKAPRGIVLNSTGTRAYVYNYVSRSVTNIDISTPTAPVIAGTALASALPPAGTTAATAQLGAELFFSARGPQGRMSSSGWSGCVTCHPDGRSDNVTWMFDSGPRQTISLDGTFNKANPHDQRILDWSALRDEVQDFELNTRNVSSGQGLINDDRLFLAMGGASGGTPTDSSLVEQFNDFSGVVSTTNGLTSSLTLPALLGARRDFGIATLPDDRVFIIGGRSGAGQGSLISGPNTVLEFNPHTNQLTTRSSTGFTPRHSLGAAAVQTSAGVRIYAIGGYTSTVATTAPAGTVEEYNPDTNTWRTVASLPTPAAQFGIAVAGGINTAEPVQLIHVVMGNFGSESTPSVTDLNHHGFVQRFQADPSGPGTWSTFTDTGLTNRRNFGAATALRGVQSRIFVFGGQDSFGKVISDVQEYLAQTLILSVPHHTAMPAARAQFGIAGTLSSNQIYVIGGVDENNIDQSTIYEYTIANNTVFGASGTPSGSWLLRGNLSAARHGLGVSNPPGVTNLLPVANGGRTAAADAIATWVSLNVRSSVPPVPASDPAAMRGRALFDTVGLVVPDYSCVTCHGGPKWTRSTVDFNPPPSADNFLGLGNDRVIGAELRQTLSQGSNPGQFPGVLVDVGTFTTTGRLNEIRANPADVSQSIDSLGANGFNIPSLLSVHETAPYFHSGSAQTLDDVLNGSQDGNGGSRQHFVSNASQRADLIAFLRSIGAATAPFAHYVYLPLILKNP